MTADQPVFNQFNLFVSDMGQSVAFYRLLGLSIPDTDPEWASHHRQATMPGGVQFDLDGREFARHFYSGWNGDPRVGVLGFRVPSRDAVDETFRTLTEAGYTGEQPPFDAFFGARYAVVLDPDGNPVGIMSPVSPDHRGSPPSPSDFS